MIDPTEQLLRDTLVEDSSRAPQPGHLVEGALSRAQAQRRSRLAIVASSLTVLVVIGVATAWSLNSPGSPREEHAPPIATPNADDVPTGPALQFRGVFVPVQEAMLADDAVHCGTAVKDAAYVVDGGPQELCLDNPGHPESITEVVLEPTETVSIAENPTTSVLEDGRTQVLSYVAERNVRLRVMSPDPALATELAAGMVVVDSPNGCSVSAPARTGPSPQPLTAYSLLAPDAQALSVCGYRNNWLTEATVVTQTQSDALVTTLAESSPASQIPPECQPGSADSESPDFWLITLRHETRDFAIWVYGNGCSRVIDETGQTANISNDLASELWKLASGPWYLAIGNDGAKWRPGPLQPSASSGSEG